MPFQTLFKQRGFSLLLGGLLATAGWLLFAVFDPEHKDYGGNRGYPLNYLVIAGGFFVALDLPGFYLRQASQAGIWGLIGFLLLFI
jgi:hypothetical protein